MTTTLELLGNPECIYKRRFRYDPCRSCNNGYNPHCENYTPVYSQRTKPLSDDVASRSNEIMDKTSGTYSQLKRNASQRDVNLVEQVDADKDTIPQRDESPSALSHSVTKPRQHIKALFRPTHRPLTYEDIRNYNDGGVI